MVENDFRFDFLNVNSEIEFNALALKTFHYQSSNIEIYKLFLEKIKISVSNIHHWKDIPCLPISFFKTHSVIEDKEHSKLSFQSSGTTGIATSTHHLVDVNVYEHSFFKTFQSFYGNPSDYCILALLPSYLERKDSSLVYMVDALIKKSGYEESGFYLNQYESLRVKLLYLKKRNIPVILFGVTFALLELANIYPFNFQNLIVIETGGMKGRGKELVREELHEILCSGFGVNEIHSEYGMTELLSQAYSKGNGIFKCPNWMKVSIREINDPFQNVDMGKSGGINIIDLANIFSCSFLSTHDLGKKISDDTFEVLGRFDNSDLRGCNLLVS